MEIFSLLVIFLVIYIFRHDEIPGELKRFGKEKIKKFVVLFLTPKKFIKTYENNNKQLKGCVIIG